MGSKPSPPSTSAKPLYEGADWTFDLVNKAYDAVQEVGVGEMGLDIYPNVIEVITSEQMLDAYASIGLPRMYRHWSFGKHFVRDELHYRKGSRALAYELVINSDPCINYIMEENSMTMHTLVLAHAAMGHNHFFKNNYLFQEWTRADAILDYLDFAKSYVSKCEEVHGEHAVEQVLDSAHALMQQGISRYPGANKTMSLAKERERALARHLYEERSFNDLWRTVPKPAVDEFTEEEEPQQVAGSQVRLPEENLLYFLEKTAPKLADWERELLRIVRNLATYFYPQRQTKVMNEGCATWTHFHIMNRLYDKGLLTEGAMLEFLHSHSSVTMQPAWTDRRYSGINPYALGFAMMRDIERMATEPTSEDKDWFPELAGCGDPIGALKRVWAEFRDDSFILQYLSPKVIRDFRLFGIHDKAKRPHVFVSSIHNEQGYRSVRKALSRQYEVSANDPDVQIIDADLQGARRLVVSHTVRNGVLLERANCERTLYHLARLWGYRVKLIEVDADSGKVLKEHENLRMP
ncbi:MAG: SpoVR family protein [Alphaproteobacteria bacterium]|nr:SpoVR family protein [Alphaproteobacteria bacterium]